MRRFVKDFSAPAAVAGLLALMVSYAGSAVIIFQAAHLAGLSGELTASWIWAVSIGSGVTGVFLSWRMKVPIITAWSTPGAALLVAMLPGIPFAEAVGAYLASAAVIACIGVTGSLDTLMKRIPHAVTSGMFAGILFSFGTRVFSSVQVDPLLSLGMFACYLLVRRLLPRYAVAAVMVAGVVLSALTGGLHFEQVAVSLARPVWTAPAWSLSTVLGLGLPLALVTLTGQYMSGMAVLHASGYRVQSNQIMAVTGLASAALAPFGSHSICLSSLTAAICTGREAHEDPSRRYVAGIVCGMLYVVAGTAGTTVASVFAALPAVFVAVLAGLALLGPFTAGIAGTFRDEKHREAGIIAFLATASGMEFLGLGAPFWGLVFGSIACLVAAPRVPLR